MKGFLEGLLAGVQVLGERLAPPWTRFAQPKSAKELGEIGEAEGVEFLALRHGFDLHRIDFRGPKRAHVLDDVESFLDYSKRVGTPAGSAVFCASDRFSLVVDNVRRPDIDSASYVPAISTAFAAWKRIASGSKIKHTALRDLIDERFEDLVDGSVLANLKSFKHRTEIDYSAELDEGKEITFKVVEGQKAQGTAKVPRIFEIEIPLFRGWDRKYKVKVRLEFDPPLPGQALLFALSLVDLDDALANAIDDLTAHVSDTLGDGWIVLRGHPFSTVVADYSAGAGRQGGGR